MQFWPEFASRKIEPLLASLASQLPRIESVGGLPIKHFGCLHQCLGHPTWTSSGSHALNNRSRRTKEADSTKNFVVNFVANFVEPAPISQRDYVTQPRVASTKIRHHPLTQP